MTRRSPIVAFPSKRTEWLATTSGKASRRAEHCDKNVQYLRRVHSDWIRQSHRHPRRLTQCLVTSLQSTTYAHVVNRLAANVVCGYWFTRFSSLPFLSNWRSVQSPEKEVRRLPSAAEVFGLLNQRPLDVSSAHSFTKRCCTQSSKRLMCAAASSGLSGNSSR